MTTPHEQLSRPFSLPPNPRLGILGGLSLDYAQYRTMPHSMGNTSSKPNVAPVLKGLTTKQAKDISDVRLHDPVDLDTVFEPDDNVQALFDEYERGAPSPVKSGQPWDEERSNQRVNTTTATPRKPTVFQPFQSTRPSLDRPVLKRINHFARRHKFATEQSFNKYTTLQRRTFERDVYDYARSIDLSKAQAKAAIIYARRLCGEEDYNSDDTRLGDDEVDEPSRDLGTLPTSPNPSSQGSRVPLSVEVQASSQAAIGTESKSKRRCDAMHSGSEKKRKVDAAIKVNRGPLLGDHGKNPDRTITATMTPVIPEGSSVTTLLELEDEPPEELYSRLDTAKRPEVLPSPSCLESVALENPADKKDGNNAKAENKKDDHEHEISVSKDTRSVKVIQSLERQSHKSSSSLKPQVTNPTMVDITKTADKAQNGSHRAEQVSHEQALKTNTPPQGEKVGEADVESDGTDSDTNESSSWNRLWMSFSIAAAQYYDMQTVTSLCAKVKESIEIADAIVDDANGQNKPGLTLALQTAISDGTAKYCSRRPKEKIHSGSTLRKTLKAYIDAAVTKRGRKKDKENIPPCARKKSPIKQPVKTITLVSSQVVRTQEELEDLVTAKGNARELQKVDKPKDVAGLDEVKESKENDGVMEIKQSVSSNEVIQAEPKEEVVYIKTEATPEVSDHDCSVMDPYISGEGQRPSELQQKHDTASPKRLRCGRCGWAFRDKCALFGHIKSRHEVVIQGGNGKRQRNLLPGNHTIKREDSANQGDAKFQLRASRHRRSNGQLTPSRDFQNPMIR
ncbi:MAG: hypothetical protein Q9170_003974 [Blastenia crenularia]